MSISVIVHFIEVYMDNSCKRSDTKISKTISRHLKEIKPNQGALANYQEIDPDCQHLFDAIYESLNITPLQGQMSDLRLALYRRGFVITKI